jgi:hypothetical protein
VIDPRDDAYKQQVLQAIMPWQSALDIRIPKDGTATLHDYLYSATAGAIKKSNDIVGYLGHGIDLGQTQPPFPPVDTSVSYGLLFPNSQCLWFNNLLLPPLQPALPPGVFWDSPCSSGLPAMDSVTQKPRIIFLGICGATSQFIQNWIVDTNNQVLIYPVYDPTDTNRELDLGLAANEYRAFLQALAQGNNVTVGDALTSLNNQTQIDIAANQQVLRSENQGIPEIWSWSAYGNSNLTFNPPIPH